MDGAWFQPQLLGCEHTYLKKKLLKRNIHKNEGLISLRSVHCLLSLLLSVIVSFGHFNMHGFLGQHTLCSTRKLYHILSDLYEKVYRIAQWIHDENYTRHLNHGYSEPGSIIMIFFFSGMDFILSGERSIVIISTIHSNENDKRPAFRCCFRMLQ